MACRLILLVALGAAVASPTRAVERETEPQEVPQNPFSLPKDRIVPGTDFRIELSREDAEATKAAFDPEQDRVRLTLRYQGAAISGKPVEQTIRILSRRVVAGQEYIEARMPDLPDIRSQSTLGGVLFPYRATLIATVVKGAQKAEGTGKSERFEFLVRIPSVPWAYFWGIFAVLLTYLVLALLQRGKNQEPEPNPWDPLSPTVTPVGGYGLSLAQVLLWTWVTVFGLVYVYWLTADFLDITPQILVLLGIGGGTALSTKLSRSSVPAKYLDLLPKRKPALRDLIWTAGRPGGPDLFKIQMLIFTLLTAYIVLVEIARKYAFPDIPENLVALMGVSSAVYVGNKMVQKGEQEKRWEEVREKADATVKEIEEAKTDSRGREKLVEQLAQLLAGAY